MTKKITISDITPGIKSGVNAVLMATALAQAERSRMDQIDREILAEFPYKADPRHIEHGRPERITEPKQTYLLCEVDAEDFYAERQRRVDALGHKGLKKGQCPALVAEMLQQDAEFILIECAQPVFGVTVEQATNNLDHYHEYIDLLCRVVVNLPGFVNPLTGKEIK